METKCAICKRAVEPGTYVQLMFDGSVVCQPCCESAWTFKVGPKEPDWVDRG